MSSSLLASNLGRIGLANLKLEEDANIKPFLSPETTLQSREFGILGYREKVREFSKTCPKSQPLVHFLDTEWLQPKNIADEQSLNLTIADISESAKRTIYPMNCSHFRDTSIIEHSLRQPPLGTATRLIIAPNLSPHIVNILGSAFDINPLIFVSALEHMLPETSPKTATVNAPLLERVPPASLFTYDCESTIETSLLCYSNAEPFEELKWDLYSSIGTIDATLREQDCKGLSVKRPFLGYDPILCAPISRDSTGTAELVRTYRAFNRVTCLRLHGQSTSTFVILTTPSNRWVEQGNFNQELQSSEQPTANWVERLGSSIWKNKSARLVNVLIKDLGNPFFSQSYDGQQLARAWDHGGNLPKNSDQGSASSHEYYGRSLAEELAKYPQHEQFSFFILNNWASGCAVQAFEDSAHYARQRMQHLTTNIMSNVRDDVDYLHALRNHHSMLSDTKDRLEEHALSYGRTTIECLSLLKVCLDDATYLKAKYRSTLHHNELKRVIRQMQSVWDLNERFISNYMADLQRKLTHTQLADSRRSVEQDATVRRLTILAFVFVPISTIGTLFGMNVKSINNIEPWVFGVSVMSTIIGVLLLASSEFIRAILSAIEAHAFSRSIGALATTSSDGQERVNYLGKPSPRIVVRVIARLYIMMYAVSSLVWMPIRIIIHDTVALAKFGKDQQQVHGDRRLDLTHSQARDMIRRSISYWFESMEACPWWYRLFWRLIFPMALVFAFVAYHLDPRDRVYTIP